MREPQVVRKPVVLKMSLTAIGSPVNGLAWGRDDRRMLYVAGQTAFYRVRMKIPGAPR